MTITWCVVPEIWSTTDRIFCYFGNFFALLTPKNPKNQNFEIMEKVPGYIIILHMCTINDNYIMYGSWDTESNRQNFCHFGPFFALSPPLKPKQSKFWRNGKKHLEILSFYTCAPYMTIILCMVSELWNVTDRIFCHSWPFFALLAP